MSVRDRCRRFEELLDRHRTLYYGLLFLSPVAARVGYAAVTSEPVADGLRSGVAFAAAFVLATAVLRRLWN